MMVFFALLLLLTCFEEQFPSSVCVCKFEVVLVSPSKLSKTIYFKIFNYRILWVNIWFTIISPNTIFTKFMAFVQCFRQFRQVPRTDVMEQHFICHVVIQHDHCMTPNVQRKVFLVVPVFLKTGGKFPQTNKINKCRIFSVLLEECVWIFFALPW